MVKTPEEAMYEIIHVVDPETSSGELRRNLQIEVVDDRPLAAGYYFVLWPVRRLNGRAPSKHYFGPFPTRDGARLLFKSALALDLIQGEQGVHSIAECRSVGRETAGASIRHSAVSGIRAPAAPPEQTAYAA